MAKLNIKVSQPMLKVVREVCEKIACVESVSIMKVSERTYQMQVCPIGLWNVCDESDLCSDGKYRFFQVIYAEDCFAPPRNISTPELVYMFNQKKVSDLDGLKELLKDMIQI